MFKNIDGIKIEYEFKKASETTLVFLHGFGGNLKNFEYFSDKFFNFGYSTLNINLTDYGFKSLNENTTIYDITNLVFKLLKFLKLKNVILVGHSFGGRISIILCSMFSGLGIKFRGLVLVDSAGIKPKFNLKNKLKILKYKVYKKLAKYNFKIYEKLNNFGSADYKSLTLNLKKVFTNIVNEDLKYLLKNIKTKTLIVFGNKDKDTPLYMAKILNKNIKNSQLKILNGGHYSYLENKENFIYLVKNYILNLDKKSF